MKYVSVDAPDAPSPNAAADVAPDTADTARVYAARTAVDTDCCNLHARPAQSSLAGQCVVQ